MTSVIQPNQICLYPNGYVIKNLIENGDKEKAIKLVASLQKIILKNMPSFNNYFLGKDNMDIIKNNEIEKWIYLNYKFFKTKNDEYKYYEGYRSNSYPIHHDDYVLLGIGAFKNKESYSYTKKDFYVLEKNFENNIEKTFYKLIIDYQ